MEEKKSIFDYLAQILIVFGFVMVMMNSLCWFFGDSAKELSAMFLLGSQGVPVEIAFQFFCISVLIVGVRIVFFTDIFIKRMSVWLRTICMLTIVVVIIAVFAIVFHWFPADMWQPWVMFLFCFGISFLGSYFVMSIKEKEENRRMDEALQRLKKREEEK
ncbi:MAG: hypothetical protein HFH41_08525 [Lachnospiraceae bacterium]|nr:hypothetical protein [Lachnospiraceae bacterium]